MRAFHIFNLMFAGMMGVVAYIELHAAVRLTALVGVLWLAAILIGPRLIGLRYFAVLQPAAGYIAGQRKYFGLWAAAWLSAHAFLSTFIYFDGPGSLLAQVERRPVLILELAGLGILLLLALLSNNWSRQHITHWKHIQAAVWAIPGMTLVSSVVAAQDFLGQPPLLLIAPVLLGLCILVGGLTLRAKDGAVDWYRLVFLVAGSVLAIGVLVVQQTV